MISPPQKNGRKAAQIFFVLAGFLLLAACTPPYPELQRPPTDADATAASLLPPGQVSSASMTGSLDGAAVVTPEGGRMEAYRFPSAGLADDALAERETRLSNRHDVTTRSSVHVGSQVYGKYAGAAVAGVYWVSNTWFFVAEARDEQNLIALLDASSAGGVSGGSSGNPWSWILTALTAVGSGVILLLLIIRMLTRRSSPPRS
jgi:hypothetical protein